MKVSIFHLVCSALLITVAIITPNQAFDFTFNDVYFVGSTSLILTPLIIMTLSFGGTYLFWSFKGIKPLRLMVWLQILSFSIGFYFLYLFFEPSLLSRSYIQSSFDLTFFLIPLISFLLSLLIFIISIFQVIYRSSKEL